MNAVKFLFLLVLGAWGACPNIVLPYDFNSISNAYKSYLSADLSELATKANDCFDSTDEVRARLSGYAGDLTITSLDDLRLRLDSDGSRAGRFVVLNGGSGDTVFRVTEDSTWKVWGSGVGTKLTLSDSLLAATVAASGTLTAVGASTLAGLSATTGTFSSTLTANAAFNVGAGGSMTLGYMNASRIPYTGASSDLTTTSNLTYTPGTTTFATANGTFSGTLGVTGQSTFAGATISGGSSGQGRLYTTGVVGLALQASAGISYDLSLLGTSGIGSYVMRVPTGTTTAEFPNAVNLSYLSSGRVPVASTGGLLTQDNLYWDATNDRLGIGSGAATPSYTLDVLRSITGSAVVARLGNSESTDPASHARLEISTTGASAGDPFVLFNNNVVNWSTGLDNSDGDAYVITPAATPGGATNGLRISTAGAVTVPGTLGVTGAATFSSTISTPLTASLPVFTNGSSQLTTNAVTGTGNVMMSASPTTTGTLTGAAANFSGAVTATQITLGGGESFVYGDTSFTMTATGMTTSPTGTAYATRVGNVVNLYVPFITGTSNSTAFTLTGIPSGWRPATNRDFYFCLPYLANNGVDEFNSGTILVSYASPGAITLFRSGSSSGWTNSGTKSIYNTSITYNLQ